jgi:hypothetical protein
MSIETDKVSKRGAVGQEAPTRRWLFGLGLHLAALNLLASAGLLPCSPVASQKATASQATTADQETKPGVAGDVVTIIQSDSTNTIGYNLVIRSDGSAAGMVINSSTRAVVVRREYPPGTIDAKKLQRLLTAIGDVSKIPIGVCMKSASFGTTTKISYAGKVSGDLQCIPHQGSGGDEALLQSSEDLAAFVRTIQHQLKLDTRSVSPNQ